MTPGRRRPAYPEPPGTTTGAAPAPVPSGRRRARATVVVGAVLLTLVLWALLWAASVHAVAGNSDGATVVLEGKSLSSGHLTLGGWALSLDSFWSVDALVYTVAVAVAGVRAALLNAVPALIAVAVIALGAVLARERRTGGAGLAAVVTVVALLGLPSRGLATFWLQGPLHVGTMLWCLVAFAGLGRRRPGWRWWAVSVLFLAAGLLGDLQTLALGVLPVFLAGLVAMRRCRDRRAGYGQTGAAVAAVVLALVIHKAATVVGTFVIAKANPTTHLAQLVPNAIHIFSYGAGLLGLVAGPFSDGGVPLALRLAHVVGTAVLLAAVVLAAAQLVRAVVAPPRAAPAPGLTQASDLAEPWRLEDLLVLAFFGDLGLFVLLPLNNDLNYARYLTAAVITGSILAGRLVGRWAGQLPRLGKDATVRAAAVVGALVLAAYAVSFGITLVQPPVPRPARQLATFLARHRLDNGIGDYWSASLVTVESDAAVAVRPVVATSNGTIVRYQKQSSARWYVGQRFSFLVYDTAVPWGGVNAASARSSFGPPLHRYRVGTYRVLVWARALAVPAG